MTIGEQELLEFSNSIRLSLQGRNQTLKIPGSQFNQIKGSGFCDTDTTLAGNAPNGISSHYRPGGTLFRLYMSSAATATVNAGELIVKWHITFRGAQPEESVQTSSFVMLTPTLNIIRSKAE
jgi:hypothetical protein